MHVNPQSLGSLCVLNILLLKVHYEIPLNVNSNMSLASEVNGLNVTQIELQL